MNGGGAREARSRDAKGEGAKEVGARIAGRLRNVITARHLHHSRHPLHHKIRVDALTTHDKNTLSPA